MYARVGKIEFEPGGEDAFVKSYRDNIGVTKAQKGFREVILFTNPETGKGISISVWESKEACLATEAPGGSLDQAIKASFGDKKRPNYDYFYLRFRDS